MNLFIDTNIFLSFYHLTSDDLEELKKLAVLLDQKQVILYLTDQVESEFSRNRENKIADALKRLSEQRLNFQFPQLCKDYDEYKQLCVHLKEYGAVHSTLLEKIKEDVNGHTLKADQIIQKLFGKAKKLETTTNIFEKAQRRIALGNPPGKNNSLGDAINWELLLEVVPNKESLNFITDDRDYISTLDENKFAEFLWREWSQLKESDLHYYRRLSYFFNQHFPAIELASEMEKELLIRKLAGSGTYARTHSTIAELSKYSEFTEPQVNDIVEAAISNNQIKWIMGDDDVFAFYKAIIGTHEKLIEKKTLEALIEMLKEAQSDRFAEGKLPI